MVGVNDEAGQGETTLAVISIFVWVVYCGIEDGEVRSGWDRRQDSKDKIVHGATSTCWIEGTTG